MENDMNNDRRKALVKLAAEVSALASIVADAISKAEELHSELEGVKDEEQEYFDNMPESLQGGDKGQAAEEAVSNMESALEALELIKDLENNLEDAVSSIESAQG